MNNFSKVFVALGVIGLGSVIASPAFSQQAYASGSSTMTLMNGAAQSIGAEVAAPGGASLGNSVSFQAAGADLGGNTAVFGTGTLTTIIPVAAPAGGSFTAAAAGKLDDLDGAGAGVNTLADNVSIIRAGAGIDGLD
jgi:hypothetical protein